MPELPEVEIMTRRLQRWVGYKIAAADGRHERYLNGNERMFATDQIINGVYRRGKFIIFALDKGALLCHNAMSGYWDSDDDRWTFDYVEGARSSSDNDIRASLLVVMPELPLHTARNLFFHDSRKFGYLRYVSSEELASKLSSVGPEMLMTKHSYEPHEISEDEFIDLCARTKHPIKQLLMDQAKIAGVGNIYAAEACWGGCVNPMRAANSLEKVEAFRVFHAAQWVLRAAIDRNLDYSRLNVYRRTQCPMCKTKIVGEELKGRKTWYCPKCQP